VASSRHKHAVPQRAGRGAVGPRPTTGGARRKSRHAASPLHRQVVKVAVPAVGVLAVLGAAVSVVQAQDEPAPATTQVAAPADDIIADAFEEVPEVDRSAERPELPDDSVVSVVVKGQLVALRDGVAVRADADPDAPVLHRVGKGDTVDVTGKTRRGWTQVVLEDLPRWVRSRDVAEDLPLGTEPCPKLSEAGMQPDTVKVFRAVCAEFPEVAEYGAIAGRGEHATGHALDVMARGELGDRIAAFLQEHRAELGIEYLIWEQRIWRPTTSDSWRPMGNRGGDTANHFDHVHVTTYGNAATG
jgi:hypothetical protein